MFEVLIPVALVATFGTVCMTSVALSSRHTRRNRLAKSLGGETVAAANLRADELSGSLTDRLILPLLTGVGRIVKRTTPLDTGKKIERKLALAGSSENWDVTRVVALKVLGAASMLAFAVLATGAGNVDGRGRFVMVAGAIWMGYMLPDVFLLSRARRRQDEIRRALPDTIDLLTIMVEAGLGFDAALAQVTLKVPGSLSMELGRMLHEVRLGVSRMDAFRNLARRIEIDELDSFITAMSQAESYGVSVSNVLRAQSTDQRAKRRQRAELKAQQLPVKMVFPLIFCILPAVFIVAVGPAVLRIMETFLTL